MAQPGVTQARAEPLVRAMDGLSLQQQGQPVGMAQGRRARPSGVGLDRRGPDR
jgi:hypothetical protein